MQTLNVISAPYILTCDRDFSVLKDRAIIFESKIQKIIPLEEAKKLYSNITHFEDSIIMPGLINLHTHLEFGANIGTLRYGSFDSWLDSVILHRETLFGQCNKELISKQLDELISSGTTTIGEVSSSGIELAILGESPLRVLFFNEAIGANPDALDFLYSNFLARYEESLSYKSSRFTPSIAIHSPYSVHPKLVEKIISNSSEDTLISTHFLESKSEKEWLESSQGYFFSFFKNFFGMEMRSHFSIDTFLECFRDRRTLFVHMLEADDEILKKLNNKNHSILTCPRSNRLLNNKLLDLDLLDDAKIPYALATDGLSSNNSLSLFDEMRASLFGYADKELEEFSKKLILSSTSKSSDIANLNCGEISEGKNSDMIVIPLPKGCDSYNIASSAILHTQKVTRSYVEGKMIY